MIGASLAVHRGTIYVGRWARTAEVRAFDLDGAPLDAGFEFRDAAAGRSTASGIAVDDDRHVWVADRAAGRVRLFTLFGTEIGGLGRGVASVRDLAPDLVPDRAGEVLDPVDVAVEGDSDAVKIVVASGGERRHAVQVFGGSGVLVASLRPLGDPRGRFRRVAGIGIRGRTLAVAEQGAGRVQVFRDGDFHFAFALEVAGRAFEPTAVAPLPCGRFVVAHSAGETGTGADGPRPVGGGLELVDAGGRHLATLAGAGRGEGEVAAPTAVAVEVGSDDARTRVFVADQDGERVQVVTLQGRCYGSFPGLDGDPRLG